MVVQRQQSTRGGGSSPNRVRLLARYQCKSVRECMRLVAGFNRLRRHVKPIDKETCINVRHGSYKDQAIIKIGWPGVMPILLKPDAITTDCGAMLVQLGSYSYLIQGE